MIWPTGDFIRYSTLLYSDTACCFSISRIQKKASLCFGHEPSLLESPDLCQDIIDETRFIMQDSLPTA